MDWPSHRYADDEPGAGPGRAGSLDFSGRGVERRANCRYPDHHGRGGLGGSGSKWESSEIPVRKNYSRESSLRWAAPPARRWAS